MTATSDLQEDAKMKDEQTPMKSEFTIEEVTDPDKIARARAQDERHRRNSEWLQTH